ncbi:MAG: ABC transporter permease subunit [Burkholderiales bacterium]|nr:ABC transporter permease subunit [Burkholderiales bacterium]MDE2157392.1 ABC transporter permease subunit [Burkholderiales bacterium]MDE2502722.1 ABC transporter permease subunit [Burkholderiales bacterium]
MARLALLPAAQGWRTYFIVLTEHRYLVSLLQTVALSLAVTAAALGLAAAVGLQLGRARFAGRRLLLSLLTLPLSFPGVIVGFFVILVGGRQGPYAALAEALTGERATFAFGLAGLFIAYLYFSLPRAIAAFTAAAEALDPALEEAARSLGAGRWALARDVWLPALAPTAAAAGAILFATAMGAFGTAFTLASRYEVLPITIYNEFTNYANFALAASLSIALGLMTWALLFAARHFGPEVAGAGA